MSAKPTFPVILGMVFATTSAASAGGNVAVIEDSIGTGQFWCEFLTSHGYKCTVFPKEGPTGPLDPFDVVIDQSTQWSDPVGMLSDVMRAGKTVVTVYQAPLALDIDSNSTVQAWIGAKRYYGGSNKLRTTVRDPILGNIPPGTVLVNCATAVCPAVADTAGHPNAIVLALYDHAAGPEPIGMMRNFWEGGVSVYLGSGWNYDIILNAVRARTLTIPTVSAWGLLVLAQGISIAGTIVLRRRRRLLPHKHDCGSVNCFSE